MFIDGRYLSAEDCDFVHFVTADLAEYLRLAAVHEERYFYCYSLEYALLMFCAKCSEVLTELK